MKIINLLLITLLCPSCHHVGGKENAPNWTKPDLVGHWRLYETKLVEEVPFLNLQAPEPNPNAPTYDSPWDGYTAHDLVFENDSFYSVDYPMEAKASAQYSLDTGYLHFRLNDKIKAYPVEFVHDTLILYSPIPGEGFFKETYVHTKFNDSILDVMKKYEVNYPELAGTWMLVHEEDYDHGTHFELQFPHALPDSIELTRKQMIAALDHEKILMMRTDGIKRDYSFSYWNSQMYFRPGKWYKGQEYPIYFYKK
jgi:hypothetical protein